MNENSLQMPKYKCHKEVHALKISDTVWNPNGSVDLFFELTGFEPINIETPESQRFKEAAGDDPGYLVVYKDGYRSWSPTDAFEEGYSLI